MQPTPHLIDEAGSSSTGPVSRLFKSFTQLFATFLTVAQTRLELFTTELREEIQRAAQVIVWAFVALFAAGIGLFLAALALIFIFWDTHRVLVSILVTCFFLGLALIAGLVLASKVHGKPRLLEGTLAEFAKDREQLQRHL